MKRRVLMVLAVLAGRAAFAQHDLIEHRLSANVAPAKHTIQVIDSMFIPPAPGEGTLSFQLHSGLKVSSITADGKRLRFTVHREDTPADDVGMDQESMPAAGLALNRYEVTGIDPRNGPLVLEVAYSGIINHPIQEISEEYARGFSQTPGLIEERGVYLAGSTCWVPRLDSGLFRFTLTVHLPEGWDAVSQGKRTLHTVRGGERITRWREVHPAEEIFLIAAQFHEYSRRTGDVDVMAFLRTPDEPLAGKYLETTVQYMDMYRKLIAPFPFSKFALVENFWQTGYGMPSFTLLGDQIIRFPFILHSSYPHELLHNYWGNSVYVDFSGGNWCEGITVYMADHLIQEQRGTGGAYRRTTLQGFTDYVNGENDFPLSAFISRTDDASSSIGYGKSMMMYHMLRQKTGDALFLQGIRTFYHDNVFTAACFADIREAFEQVTGDDLALFFSQWIDRTGAPELELSDVEVKKRGDGYQLLFTLSQIQPGPAYTLDVPVAVTARGGTTMHVVSSSAKSERYALSLAVRPQRLDVDPSFDVFRRLHYREVPPSFSSIFGADSVLILLPSQADKALLDGYRALAESWSAGRRESIEVALDSAVPRLADTRAVWIFGKENLHRSVIEKGLEEYGAAITGEAVAFPEREYSYEEKSFAVAVPNPANPKTVAVWLHADLSGALPGLGRKLPHYGKYSYLVFDGDEPANIGSGQWTAVNSPLSAMIPGPDGVIPAGVTPEYPAGTALAMLEPVFSEERLLAHVGRLSAPDMEGRVPGSDGIEKAAAYIAGVFGEAGLEPAGDSGSWFQTFELPEGPEGAPVTVKNVIGMLPGTREAWDGQSVVVCAHYDHLGRGWPDVHSGDEGVIHPGADDNASGVAVMLELARQAAQAGRPLRTILFIAFTGEESGLRGSQYYVKHAGPYPPEKIMGVLNLDTVGRLGDKKLLVLNSGSAREWKFIFMGVGHVTGVEADLVTQDITASDQASFIGAGVPAVQFFSGPHADYHRPGDTADKIDAAGMVKTAVFVKETLQYLIEREEPMNFTSTADAGLKPAARPSAGGGATAGTMPDFAYQGTGVRIGAVSEESAAAGAGLMKGDVIIRLAGTDIGDLRAYSNVLKSKNPGEIVEVVFLRDGKEMTVNMTLGTK
ncbi:M20/M25/M40 family metallo-hydrolase [bacterium]|nr:M20/M25/M40 family metallo-hydrolase [bacterium]